MRGPILAVCLAAALVIWHALPQPPEPTDAAAPPTADAPETAVVPSPPRIVATPAPPVTAPPSLEPEPWGSQTAPISTAAAFVYSKNHPATPLPALALAAMAGAEPQDADEFGPIFRERNKAIDVSAGQVPQLSRNGLCNAIVAVARANDLPIPFFANLIWQESSFRSKTISPAGALGIAQFIPETAIEHGLMNQFEPVHALHASGKLLRKLIDKFGNLGFAAAAYNAGPQRVYDWMADRRTLPGETRAYVIRITGYGADRWQSSEFRNGPDATLMPARAPCAEVAEEVQTQGRIVRVAKLMTELAASTAPRPADATATASRAKPDAKAGPKLAAQSAASGKIGDRVKPEISRHATQVASKVQSKPAQRTSLADKTAGGATASSQKRVAAR